MGITLDYDKAKRRLAEAVELAKSDRELPASWTDFTEALQRTPYMTYTPALGGALLARATDSRVDPLSLKADFGENTYSLRGLCHKLLVPAAVEYGFSIRNTGREPINNMPFFRYEHMTQIEAVRDPAVLQMFLEGLSQLSDASEEGALLGLAAFLRYRFSVTAEAAKRRTLPGQLDLASISEGLERFLGDNVQRPKKTQALVAACMDLIHEDVRSRRLNDPSRDVPGDVQAYVDEVPHLAVEARAKPVLPTETQGFVQACAAADIGRAFLVVDHPSHRPLPKRELRAWAAAAHGISLSIYESVADLFADAIALGSRTSSDLLSDFASTGMARLQEIETSETVQNQWMAVCETAVSSNDDTPRPYGEDAEDGQETLPFTYSG